MKKLLSVLMLPVMGITLSLVAPIANAQEGKKEEKKEAKKKAKKKKKEAEEKK